MFKAVVFAYSEVGAQCLAALLDAGVHVALVFTHEDRPGENVWFASVAALASARGIEVVTPDDPNGANWVAKVGAIAPQYIFSFYYRSMLGADLLRTASWAALNLHGSLLPKYRGRACINWAILNGETQTGATLHYMVAKPDAGPIVAQESVTIGIDDTALIVSRAVAAAAARLIARCTPLLAAGPPPGRAMNLAKGSYYGGRTPEDGRIDWSWPAKRVHALIRAVAPPFPGAFTDVDGKRLIFTGSRWSGQKSARAQLAPCLYVEAETLHLDCSDGLRLDIDAVELAGEPLDARAFSARYGESALTFSSLASKRKVQL